jgi:hypothetical protein
MNNETFYQYCTRRTGFGKTPWPQFASILIFSIAVTVSVASFAPWLSPLGMLPFAVLVLGTYMNYTRRWK